ncbi:MAG: hypothetical protein L7F78_17995 [Syntrophales bacterium LBB04]|nr:hypothetical protein [Syntrophales bacterium LBB04]
MHRSGFLRIQHVIKFIEEVFGDNLSFEIEGADEVIRNEGRRTEDMSSTRTFLEQRCSNIAFNITFCDDTPSDGAKSLPEVFTNPDFPKILRNRYREINRTEIQYWKIDYSFSRLVEAEGNRHQVSFRFTVGYGRENL